MLSTVLGKWQMVHILSLFIPFPPQDLKQTIRVGKQSHSINLYLHYHIKHIEFHSQPHISQQEIVQVTVATSLYKFFIGCLSHQKRKYKNV